MTAKEFLRRARGVDRRVNEATERVDRLRAKLEAGRMSSLTGMPRGGSGDSTRGSGRCWSCTTWTGTSGNRWRSGWRWMCGRYSGCTARRCRGLWCRRRGVRN